MLKIYIIVDFRSRFSIHNECLLENNNSVIAEKNEFWEKN